MDALPNIGAFASSSYPDPPPAPAQPTMPGSAPPPGSPAASAVGDPGGGANPAIFSPAIADSPSPAPQAIVTDTENLPLAVKYAPSAVPHDVSAAYASRRQSSFEGSA